jgi:hypothetical protein
MMMKTDSAMNCVEAAVGMNGLAMYSVVINSSLCSSLYGFQ